MTGSYVWSWTLLLIVSCRAVAEPAERLPTVGMDCGPAGEPLPALNADIDEGRLEFDNACAAPGSFGGDQRGAGAAKGIKDQPATVGAVADRVGDHGHRLDRGVQSELARGGAVQGILTDIVADVAAMPAIAPECDIIDVRPLAHLEHVDELVLRAVQRPHAGVALVPDAEVFEFAVDLVAGRQHLALVAPIHADVVDGPVDRAGRRVA